MSNEIHFQRIGVLPVFIRTTKDKQFTVILKHRPRAIRGLKMRGILSLREKLQLPDDGSDWTLLGADRGSFPIQGQQSCNRQANTQYSQRRQ